MTIRFHRGDLPEDYAAGAAVAIDTETLGLNPHRDRLCVVQLSGGDGNADVVQIVKDGTAAGAAFRASSPIRRSRRSSISRASTSACSITGSASCRGRSIAPRSPRS